VKGEVPLRKALLAPTGICTRHDRHLRRHALRLPGCIAHLPGNAEKLHHGRAQIEFPGQPRGKAPFTGEARAVHLGRHYQVWDAVVTHGEERRRLALFRCTQLLIYPRTAVLGGGRAQPAGSSARSGWSVSGRG